MALLRLDDAGGDLENVDNPVELQLGDALESSDAADCPLKSTSPGLLRNGREGNRRDGEDPSASWFHWRTWIAETAT
jgi:hypothetical protein